MVRVLDVDKREFPDLLLNKKLICFGMGKGLKRFLEYNPDICIHGIIDNYAYAQKTYLDLGERGRIPVWPAVEFGKNIKNRDIVVLVTSMAMEEMVEQLDRIDALDGVPCVLEAALDGFGCETADGERIRLAETVSYLTRRTRERVAADNFEEKNKTQPQKRYQIWEYFGASNIGGSKARLDIKSIVGNMGYQLLKVHTSLTEGGTSAAECGERLVRADWSWCHDTIAENAYVLIQHPAPRETRLPEDILWRMKREKKVRIICLVHEIEALRRKYDTALREEEARIVKRLGDIFIVHNEAMRRYYIEQGVDKDRVISLGIFDYLGESANTCKIFEKSVTIAANLSLEKSPYLTRLGKLFPLKIHLYGPNFSSVITEDAPNVEYHGSVAPDVLPGKLDRGFGLVWDGEGLDTCSGGLGEYLLYNNPHKLSLYLASGMPVIIWGKAAEADFVIRNNVGITVDSLYEVSGVLERCDMGMYEAMARNAEKISYRLKKGEYMKQALGRAEECMGMLRPSC